MLIIILIISSILIDTIYTFHINLKKLKTINLYNSIIYENKTSSDLCNAIVINKYVNFLVFIYDLFLWKYIYLSS